MNKSERIYRLDEMLKNNRYPVSKEQLMERLECSQATLYRIIAEVRDAYAAPIESNEHGFFYDKAVDFELPGLRLNTEEIQGLLMVSQLLEDIETEALKQPLQRLLSKVESLLEEHGIGHRKNIRIIRALSRQPDSQVFNAVLNALQKQTSINIEYQARSTKQTTHRDISPQQLTSYKNAWYLEAWCHLREGIRSFALEQITSVHNNSINYRPVDSHLLRDHFSSSYGIFSGSAKATAQIKFDTEIAAWAATERWHSKQCITHQEDGSVIIDIPFNKHQELMMDILRYGQSATVIKPKWLREEMRLLLEKACANYNP